MNTLKLKLVALVVLFFSNYAFADLPRPIYSYHHRLHRIGYEALPSSNYYGDMVLYLLFPIVFLLLCVGLIILFKRRKISLNSIFSTGKRLVSVMKRNKVFVFFVILMIFSGIFILLLLYGRRLTSKCIMDLYGVESRTVGGNRILHVYHDDGPGWYYSDAVPDLDRKIIMEKITYGLLYDLQKSIVQSGVWICEGAEEYCLEECSGRKSKNDIFLKVLKNRKDLAVRCHGIPIEWLIKRIIFPVVVPGVFDGCSPTKQVDVTEHCMGKVWDFYCNRKRTEQFKDDDVNQLIKIQDEYLSRIQEFRKENITYGLLYDLQKAVDEYGVWICGATTVCCREKCNGLSSKKDILLNVLKVRKDLAVQCHGIPIELLMKRIIFQEAVPAISDDCLFIKQEDVFKQCMGKLWEFYCNRKRSEQFIDDDQFRNIREEYFCRIQDLCKKKITYGLLYDLQKAIIEDDRFVYEATDYEKRVLGEYGMSEGDVLLAALNCRKDLAERCHGISIRLLTERLIFRMRKQGSGRGFFRKPRDYDIKRKLLEFYDSRNPNESFKDDDVQFLRKILEEVNAGANEKFLFVEYKRKGRCK